MDEIIFISLLFFYSNYDYCRIWGCCSCMYSFFLFFKKKTNIKFFIFKKKKKKKKKTTSEEYILCIVTMLIACGVFAYAVN